MQPLVCTLLRLPRTNHGRPTESTTTSCSHLDSASRSSIHSQSRPIGNYFSRLRSFEINTLQRNWLCSVKFPPDTPATLKLERGLRPTAQAPTSFFVASKRCNSGGAELPGSPLKAERLSDPWFRSRREDAWVRPITPFGVRIAFFAGPVGIQRVKYRIGNDMSAIQRA